MTEERNNKNGDKQIREKKTENEWSQNLFLWKGQLSWQILAWLTKKSSNLSQKYNWRCYYQPFRDRVL